MSNQQLGSHSARGGAYLIISQGVKFVCQLVSLSILARFLAPSDFGLFVMSGAIVHFFMLVGTLGFAQAVIQNKKMSEQDLNSLFWISSLTGFSFCALVYAAAPLFAVFYSQESVTPLIRGLGCAVAIQGLGVLSRAMLEKEFKFLPILVIEALASLLGLMTAITLVLNGVKAWTLVFQELTVNTVLALGFLFTCRWKPGFNVTFGALRCSLKYGFGLTGSNAVHYLSRNLDNVMIGERFGNAALGLYQKAYSLVLLPITQINQPLSRVLLPALSRLKDQPDAYTRAYRNALSCLCSVTIPIVACMGLISQEMILIVLGENWQDANQYFLLLLPASFIGATNMGTAWVYTSYGHTGRQFKWSMYNAVAIITGIALSSRFSVTAVAATVSGLFVVLRTPGIRYCFHTTPLNPSDYWRPVIRQGLSSVFSALLLTVFFRYGVPDQLMTHPFISLVSKTTLFFLVTVATDRCLPGKNLLDNFHYIRRHYGR